MSIIKDVEAWTTWQREQWTSSTPQSLMCCCQWTQALPHLRLSLPLWRRRQVQARAKTMDISALLWNWHAYFLSLPECMRTGSMGQQGGYQRGQAGASKYQEQARHKRDHSQWANARTTLISSNTVPKVYQVTSESMCTCVHCIRLPRVNHCIGATTKRTHRHNGCCCSCLRPWHATATDCENRKQRWQQPW